MSARGRQDNIPGAIAFVQLMKETERHRWAFTPGEGAFWRDGNRWKKDDDALEIKEYAAKAINGGRLKGGAHTPASVARLVEHAFKVPASRWNADAHLVGLNDGRAIDLRAKKIIDPGADAYISLALAMTPIDIGRSLPPRRWNDALLSLLREHEEIADIIHWIRWFLLQSLFGEVTSACYLFLMGRPGSGKSTFLRAWLSLMGEYGQSLLAGRLLDGRDDHLQWLAGLRHVRFVLLDELPQGKKMRGDLLKVLVNPGRIRANLMAKNDIEFENGVTLAMTSNYSPRIAGDAGVFRRTRGIRCDALPRTEDEDMLSALLEEGPQALGWVLGAPPDEPVRPACFSSFESEFRGEPEGFSLWLAERTWPEEHAWTPYGDLWSDYRSYSQSEAHDTMSEREFQRALTARGYRPARRGDARQRTVGRMGLRLR